jgi:hypothetical protein
MRIMLFFVMLAVGYGHLCAMESRPRPANIPPLNFGNKSGQNNIFDPTIRREILSEKNINEQIRSPKGLERRPSAPREMSYRSSVSSSEKTQ